MAISDKLQYLQETKEAIKTAIVDKGVDVSENDTFRSYADKIGEISGGGGDIVYAVNQSSSTPDGKVLVREGKAGSNEFNKDIFSSKSSIEAKGWYDDNTIIGSFLNKENRRIRYVDDSWQEEVLNTMLPKTGNSYNFFWTTNNGRVISKSWFIYTYNNPLGQEYFIGPDGFSTVSSNACSGYLGEYNGVHYGFKDKENDVYVYNPDTGNFASSSFINGPSSHNNGFLEGNKILLVAQTTSHDYRMYELNSDGSYTTLCSDGKYNSSYGILKIFGVTGLEIGDYVLALDDGDSTTTQVKSSLSDLTYSNACKLVLLQITDGYVLTPVSLPMLQQFETVDCRISYDRRNKVLMIGTKLGVFAYQFDSQTKTFSELPLGLGLPAITMGTVYCPYMSPNKKRILVTLPMSGVVNDAGSYAEKVWIYQLDERNRWFIIDNRTLNYQPDSVYTGLATGNVDESGKYEVETVLDKFSNKEWA